jgi:hypothetical protein
MGGTCGTCDLTTGGCSFVGDKPKGRNPSSKPRRGRDAGTRMHPKIVFRDSLDWIELAQD